MKLHRMASRHFCSFSLALFAHSSIWGGGVFQLPLTLIILPQQHHNTNGSHITIQIGGVKPPFCQETDYFCKSIVIEMKGASRYFSEILGSEVDLTLLIYGLFSVHVALFTIWWFTSDLKGPLHRISQLPEKVEGVVQQYPKTGDSPKKVPSNPPKGSIKSLKRFHRTPKASIEPPFGPRKGSIEPK